MVGRPEERLTPIVRTLFFGFGPLTQSAARVLLRRGQALDSMRVMEPDPARAAAAGQIGIACIPWHVHGLFAPFSTSIATVIVELDDDERAIALVRALRAELPAADIIVAVRDPGMVSIVLNGGATRVVSEASIGGALLAETVTGATRGDGSVH